MFYTVLLSILFIILSLLAIVFGLIKPSIVIKWGDSERRTRGQVVGVYGLSTVMFAIIFIVSLLNYGSHFPQSNEGVSHNTEIKNNIEEKPKQKTEDKPKEVVAEKMQETEQKPKIKDVNADFGITPATFIEEYNKRAKVINKNLVSSSSVPLNENSDHNEFRMVVSKQIISGLVKKDSGKVYDITIPSEEFSEDEEKKEFAQAMAIVVNVLSPELNSKEILELISNDLLNQKKIAIRGGVSYEFNKYNMFIAKAVK